MQHIICSTLFKKVKSNRESICHCGLKSSWKELAQINFNNYVNLHVAVVEKFIYHKDLKKRGGCGVVAHERLESHVSLKGDCYQK